MSALPSHLRQEARNRDNNLLGALFAPLLSPMCLSSEANPAAASCAPLGYSIRPLPLAPVRAPCCSRAMFWGYIFRVRLPKIAGPIGLALSSPLTNPDRKTRFSRRPLCSPLAETPPVYSIKTGELQSTSVAALSTRRNHSARAPGRRIYSPRPIDSDLKLNAALIVPAFRPKRQQNSSFGTKVTSLGSTS